MWYPSGNRIALGSDDQFAGALVRHEMLHALLQRGGHPRSVFVNRCGGVVACDGECREEAAPPPLASVAPSVPSTSMEVGATLWPAAPSIAFQEGNFQLLVSVRNPHATSVDVESLDARFGLFYGYRATSVDGGVNEASSGSYDRAPEMRRFRPGESRTYLFDFRIGRPNAWPLRVTPGTYAFEGHFGDAVSTQRPVVTIAP